MHYVAAHFHLDGDANADIPNQDHKKAVKEEKREKRKDKLPKHIKKKLINSTGRKR